MGPESYNRLQLMGNQINLLGPGGGGGGAGAGARESRSCDVRLCVLSERIRNVSPVLKHRLVIGLISHSNHLTSPQRRSDTLITESL